MAITFTNKGRTTLHASVTSGDVVFTIPVADVSKLPSSGQYDLAIENEYVTVTGGQGTSSLTVTRHQYGTTAAGYSAGTALVETVTAAELALFLQSDQAVTSLDVSGGTGATGDVRLAAGTDIGLARTGEVITISLVSGAATAGQVLEADGGGSAAWADLPASFANPMTAQDDLILGGTAGAATRLASTASRYLITDSSGHVGWRQPTLGADTDVAISSPSAGQVLTYDSGTSTWENQTPSPSFANPMTAPNDLILGGTAGAATRLATANSRYLITDSSGVVGWRQPTLGAGSDVALSSPTNGQVLTYDSSTGKWENQTPSAGSSTLAADTDVALSSPTNGQVLTYDSSTGKWENQAPSGGGSSTLAADTDVAITSPSDGQVLTYDGTASKWKNVSSTGPMDLASFVPGAPGAAQLVLAFVVPSGITQLALAGNLSGSRGKAGTAPTATASYTVAKNGTTVGTVSIATSGTVTFSTTGGSAVTLSPGDELTVTAPSSQDATLSDVRFTLAGTRS